MTKPVIFTRLKSKQVDSIRMFPNYVTQLTFDIGAQPGLTIDIKVGIERELHKRTKYWEDHYGRLYIRHFLPQRMNDSEKKHSTIDAWSPMKVPHYKRVEKLIQIELGDLIENKAYGGNDFWNTGPPPRGTVRPERSPCTCTQIDCASLCHVYGAVPLTSA
jgi:T5orf172 domain